MTRRRGSSIPRKFVRWNGSLMALFLLLIVFLGIEESRGDYLMGGHLDNKDDEASLVMTRRSDDEETSSVARTSVVSSRTSSFDDLDRDFDLELDLLGEKSSSDSSRTSIIASSATSEDATLVGEESGLAPRYRVPPYAFNGGQPFSLEKDPITGQIDFEKAPPLKALEYNAEKSVDEKLEDESGTTTDTSSNADTKSQRDESLGPNEINPYSPSFHDFLNLPVRYTYDKYDNSEKYPLISNSYANTKVQSGTNSYNTHNHKKYHEAVKAGVDIQTLYVQPSRKTYVQSVTKMTTARPSTTTSTTTTTTQRTTTSKTTTDTPTTTTTQAPTTSPTTKTPYPRYPEVTTWKPQQRPNRPSNYGVYTDYEGTLPIERLQTISTSTWSSTTEKSRYAEPPSRPKPLPGKPQINDGNTEYEEGYEDYDRIYQNANKSPSQEDQSNQSDDSSDSDYAYTLDLLGDSRPVVKQETSTTESTVPPTLTTSSVYTSDTTTSTFKPTTTIFTVNDRRPDNKDDRTDHTSSTTTSRPSITEEKRVTSMQLDTNNEYRPTNTNYGNNGIIIGGIDNTIPTVSSNNILYQHGRPSNKDQYYSRPPIGLPSAGIVVKSASNVVVPPGQDTVSFVLGNRQSVGSVSDAGSDFYGMHSGTINDRMPISFGKIGNSRPGTSVDNFSGQMIVSAGIGVGSNSVGSYHQRPPPSGDTFDHAVVAVGMPTVDVVNPGESAGTVNANKNVDSSTNSLDSLAQKWWASTNSANTNAQQGSKEPTTHQQPFGYHVVFPDEKGKPMGSNGATGINENSQGTRRPIEEHVIVVHESDLGAGNTIRLDLPSQSSSTLIPTTGYHYETTTQRLPSNPDEQLLPELSERLTPPAERPNILPSGIQRPPSSYNYYHHQTHSPPNLRPNDYRDQRPQRLPPPSVPSSTGFKRRPPLSSIESNLPNILPQFRPNAKTSHGHNRGETIGTIPAGAVPPYVNTRIRRPPPHLHHHRPPTSRRPTGPSHLQRLNPPPLPPPPPPITSLRLPTPASLIAPGPNLGIANQHDSQSQNNENAVRLAAQNRLHKVTVGVPPSLAIDERHHQSGGFGISQQITSRLEDDGLERFSADPPQQPPRPPYFTKRTTPNEQVPDGIPRIATLQMIQQHGARDEDTIRPNLPPPYRFNNEKNSSNRQDVRDSDGVDSIDEDASRPSANRRGDEDKSEELPQGDEGTRADYGDAADSPVYVVYPVKGALDIRPTSHENDDADDASVVLGTYGPQRPLPPDTLLQDSEDNDSDDLTGIGEHVYRPSSIVNVSPTFTDSSAPQLASDFPYPLERPDPSMFTSQMREKPLLVPSEQQQKNGQRPDAENTENGEKANDEDNEDVIRDIERDASVNVIPYLQDHVPFTLKENAGAISATLHRLGGGSSNVAVSSTPIAYVYTPTTRAPLRRTDDPYLHASFERGPILLPSQQPSSSSSSAPSPQSFMAPFVASASAEAPSKNGWSVVMIGQSPSNDPTSMDRRRQDTDLRDKENKDTSDNDKDKQEESTMDSDSDSKDEETQSTDSDMKGHGEVEEQTEKSEFDVENFTPQLYGGFQPIMDFQTDTESDTILGDKVNGGAVAMAERPRSKSV